MSTTLGVQDCPLPEVAEALGPFIKPRREVTNIRQGLQAYLQNQLRTDGTPLSSVNLTQTGLSLPHSPPQALSGVRKAYYKALVAHTAAQAKYDALRVELEQIKHNQSAPETTEDNRTSISFNDGYITLLQQKEKHRKLQVIEDAFSTILSNSGETSNLDDMIRRKIGDLPTPPSTQPSFNRNPEVEGKMMELKKAVVSSKRRVDEQRTRGLTHAANGAGETYSSQAEIAGLQKALQVLTGWMENQLTVIAAAEPEVQQDAATPVRTRSSSRSQASAEDVETLYEDYIDARQRLVQTVNDPTDTRSEPRADKFGFETDNPSSRSPSRTKASTRSAAETILPHIPALVAAKQEEQTLIQQSAYIRRQLSAAEDETARLIQRLAHESHLVQPAASSGSDWAEAAREAGSTTEQFMNQRLEVGVGSVEAAENVLRSVRALPSVFDGLVDKS
ncbi:hypothetical protein LTR37_006339 [Vermiconidia calcicola]|uniref:Uncharacterized protein n=1 Tax=Vermiconidia calcicola TaxID=1690605 RepID=A0ACC3NIH1_9PEZI|nr:hypothetical protein LTR37_006339 [Vermiconidia calcicola]